LEDVPAYCILAAICECVDFCATGTLDRRRASSAAEKLVEVGAA